ncbi:response regulator [Lentibacter algarum]|uniref:response regulator n=1 Tax=Lentibacter algarum TaxID=576131 RepID=UPI001C06C9DF|nr:response regulator [Lentibacter algarum]MBU2981335.1 response regulator [Lentibacter algarum]
MDDFTELTLQTNPTAARPLLGLTVLVVEDSRYACEAMRLLCLRSGARIRRADCIASARRHLQVYRPSVIMIDLGLPDGSGLDLIKELAQATPKIDVIIGISGEDQLETKALEAGAHSFMAKPIDSIGTFQQTVLAHLPKERCPSGPRVVVNETVRPDPLSFNDDLTHVANLISDGHEPVALGYLAQFVTGVAKSAHDHALAAAGEELARAHTGDKPTAQSIAKLAGMIQERLERPIAI